MGKKNREKHRLATQSVPGWYFLRRTRAIFLQDEESGKFRDYSAAWVPDSAQPQDDWAEDGEGSHVRLQDLENYYHSLATGSTSIERSCTPLRCKEVGPCVATASRIPTHSHYTIRQYTPRKITIISTDCFRRVWVRTHLKQISCGTIVNR
jgi:hypothetical protein